MEGSRDILPRDIIAVILNFIDKKYIELEIRKDIYSKDNYIYIIKRIAKSKERIDFIENFVYDWIFEKYDEVNLIEILKELPNKNIKKFEELNIIVQKELNKRGANKKKVPYILRILNTLIWIFSFIILIRHLDILNIFSIFDSAKRYIYLPLILFLPFIIIFLINIFNKMRYLITRRIYKITERKIVVTVITILLVAIIFFIILSIKGINLENIMKVDFVLILISTIIALTDNIMIKNDINRIEDYNRLKLLKEKIKKYSLLSEKDIEYINLWDKYMAYGVSFGIVEKVHNKYGNIILDAELLQMCNSYEFNSNIISAYISYDRKIKEYNDKNNYNKK